MRGWAHWTRPLRAAAAASGPHAVSPRPPAPPLLATLSALACGGGWGAWRALEVERAAPLVWLWCVGGGLAWAGLWGAAWGALPWLRARLSLPARLTREPAWGVLCAGVGLGAYGVAQGGLVLLTGEGTRRLWLTLAPLALAACATLAALALSRLKMSPRPRLARLTLSLSPLALAPLALQERETLALLVSPAWVELSVAVGVALVGAVGARALMGEGVSAAARYGRALLLAQLGWALLALVSVSAHERAQLSRASALMGALSRPQRPVTPTARAGGAGGDWGDSCDPRHPAPPPRALSPEEEEASRSRWGKARPREDREPPRRPDIILISSDGVRADHTSLGGAPRERTPHLARLSPKGVVFTKAYSPSSSTRQTIRSLFTGVYPSLSAGPHTRRWALSLRGGQATLAERLATTGYHTFALIGARGTFTSHPNALRGFMNVDTLPAKVWEVQHHAAPTHVERIISHLSDPTAPPAFIWTHMLDTHQLYAPGPHARRFEGPQGRYQSALHSVDGALGRLLEFALSPTRRHRTVVIFTSDHGQSFGEWGVRPHLHGTTTNEAETHVPLVIWSPLARPQRRDEPVTLLDLYPTILRLAGLPTPEWACGVDLGPALFEGAALPERGIFLEQMPDYSEDHVAFSWIEGGRRLDERPLLSQWALNPLGAWSEGQAPAEGALEERARLRDRLRAHLKAVGLDLAPYLLD